MPTVVLVQALCVEEIDVRYCCMCDLYGEVAAGFRRWIGDIFWAQCFEVLWCSVAAFDIE